MISQENFNTILFGIRGQGGPAAKVEQLSHHPHVFCSYRTDSGRKCSAGWLLPDGDPEATPEQSGTAESLTFFKDNFTDDERSSIRQLQIIHDESATKEVYTLRTDAEFFLNWEPRMKKFAEANDLTYTPPAGV